VEIVEEENRLHLALTCRNLTKSSVVNYMYYTNSTTHSDVYDGIEKKRGEQVLGVNRTVGWGKVFKTVLKKSTLLSEHTLFIPLINWKIFFFLPKKSECPPLPTPTPLILKSLI
jgi:hypothetical protein